MLHEPVPLFLGLAALMTVAVLAADYVRGRWLGLPRRRWTFLGWALVAAVLAYFLIQGHRHA